MRAEKEICDVCYLREKRWRRRRLMKRYSIIVKTTKDIRKEKQNTEDMRKRNELVKRRNMLMVGGKWQLRREV